jgi:hypothetical protein
VFAPGIWPVVVVVDLLVFGAALLDVALMPA